MSGTIYKFEKDMLHGDDIYINKKLDNSWTEKHWHNYYEMIYYQKAHGYCMLNGERKEISDGSLFLLTPKDFHEVRTEAREDSCIFIIAFNECIIDKTILDAVTKGAIAVYEIPESLSAKLSELYEVFRSEKKHRKQWLLHLFNCILLETLGNARAVSGAEKDISPIVRESISVMLSDPTAGLSLGFFADKFNITESYFSRLFHKQTGVTFKQYLTELRLEYARQLLDENGVSIIDVGYECGFNTPSQFYRAFKGAYKMTPSEYREIMHQRKNTV